MTFLKNLRKKIALPILFSHIISSRWEPQEDNISVGVGYFEIDQFWYTLVRFISGMKPEELIKDFCLSR